MKTSFLFFALLLPIIGFSQTDVGLYSPGTYGSNPANALFEVAIKPNVTYTFPPAAAELNMIVYAPLEQLNNSEVFTVVEDRINGGVMGWDASQNFDYQGNRYYVFTYSGTGINLTSFPRDAFSLAFTIGLTGGTGGAIFKIADQNSDVFNDFAARAALNLQGVNQFNGVSTPASIATGALPLDLLSLRSTTLEKSVALNWNTENEVNVSHFEIERRVNSNFYQYIGSIRARNTATARYDFIDRDVAANGTYYYRLKIIDADQSHKYSPIVNAVFDSVSSIVVFPNPTTETVTINAEGTYTAILLNAGGQKCLQTKATGNLTLSIGEFPAGIYTINILDDKSNVTYSERVVIK